jgi:hypothetical protein
MTTTLVTPSGSSGTGASSMDSVDEGRGGAGPYMLTLCGLPGPVSIRPAQSPQLRRFTFFTTCTRQHDGAEQVYLNMGYFQTLTDAQKLLPVIRRRFPDAIAIPTPAALLKPKSFAPVTGAPLTDTQVMKILEARGTAPAQNEAEETSRAQIGVLRPEDTSTRRALKEAVVQGAPVFFAVQLDWSERRIDPGRVPSLPLFKTHTLYATESRREGHCRYFLRLGFFTDAASAKEAAFQVRSKFASAVVVPVAESEITRAREAAADPLGFIYSEPPSQAPGAEAKPRPAASRSARRLQDTETLEQTLETLAERERWNSTDSLSESGVRHLKVQVLERKSS